MTEVICDELGSLELSEMDRGERVEKILDICETDAVQQPSTTAENARRKKETITRQTVRRHSRCSRLAAVCLGLLCVLLITITLLYIHQRDELLSSIRNLTDERDQLNISLQNMTGKNFCFNEWKKNNSSFYFFSIGLKNWKDARQDCTDRGADLVIINSVEEQAFLIDQKRSFSFWIGLTDAQKENTWKWVDDQLLTDEFWKKTEPNNAGLGEDCAVFTTTAEDDHRTWNDLPCSCKENWVCEINLEKSSHTSV